MDFLTKALGVILIVILAATFGGIVVWACWDVLYTVFPNAGIPKEIALWDAIKLSWLAAALIKSSGSSSSSSTSK